MTLTTKKQVRKEVLAIPLKIRKRLRLQIDCKKYYTKRAGYQLHMYIPAFINIDVDKHFTITEHPLTYTFTNSKVSVTIFKDENVSANITIF